METLSPRVSVLLPVYNGAAFVKDAVDSIRGQTYADWELLVVDDGSKDESAKVCQALAATDARIKFFQNETNLGLARTMNRLVSLAGGQYLAVQEQDDFAAPSRLEREVQVLDSRSEVGLVSGVAAWLDDAGKVWTHFPGRLHRGEAYPTDRAEMVRFLFTEQCKVVNAACMFRREVAAEIPGPFDAEARMSIDWQFFIHVAHRHQILGLPEVLVRMRRGGGHKSLTGKKELQFREARRCLRKMYEQYRADERSPINRQLFRQAMATELVLEGRAYSRVKGVGRVLQALVCQPTHRRAWQTLGEFAGRGLGKMLGTAKT